MRRIPSGPLLKNASPSERSTGSNQRLIKDEIDIPESRGDIDAQKEGFGINCFGFCGWKYTPLQTSGISNMFFE